MFSSPAKRRRSNSSGILVDAPNTSQQLPGHLDNPPQVSNRASFKSPTRASLARSHPDILSKVLSRSPAKTVRENGLDRLPAAERNRFGLQIQKGRKSSLPATTDIPVRSSKPGHQVTGSSHRSSSVPAQAFSGPPRRLSRRLWPSESAGRAAEPLERSVSPRERGEAAPNGQLVSELEDATRLSGSNEVPGDSVSLDNEDGEPDLPPTPTELGLEKVPSRPRGLLSSSPGWRQGRKKTLKFRKEKRPSPLKPKDVRLDEEEEGMHPQSPALGVADEKIPDDMREKQNLRDQLAAQLKRLQDDIARLEDETRRSERPDEYSEPGEEAARNLIRLLTTPNPSCAPPLSATPSPPLISSLLSTLLPFSSTRFLPPVHPDIPPFVSPENPFALENAGDPISYLTLFAPLSLITNTTSISVSTHTSDPSQPRSHLTQSHNLVLSAPSPFPPRLFRIPITLLTDPERQSVIAISIPTTEGIPRERAGNPSIPMPLLDWMGSRLSNPLLQHDISGLCWGICRYWEAAAFRARIWARLEHILAGINSSKSKEKDPNRSDDRVDDESISHHFLSEEPNSTESLSLRTLLPHLDRSSLLFSTPTSVSKSHLLITCPLTLDQWTSEPQLVPDICVSVSHPNAGKIEREAKKVFRSLLKSNAASRNVEMDPDSLVRAVEGVVRVVFGRS